MRFLVYGAGAIGGVLGGLLHRAGHEVVLIARGAHLRAITTGGLRLETPEGAETLPITAVAEPDVLERAPDAVLLTMKTNDTAGAVDRLSTAVPPDTPIVCVQNAVENERLAARFFSAVYAVCVMFPAAHLTPGVVQAQSSPVPGILDIGRYPNGLDDDAHAVAAAFQDAGFDSVPRPDIMRWKYRKLVMNLGNAFDALCHRSEETTELMRDVRAEGERCLDAAGIDVASTAEDAERRDDILQIRPVAGRDRTGGSSWQSLHRGTGAIESAYLNGEMCLLGRWYAVPTPLNALALRLAQRAAREGWQPGQASAHQVRSLLRGADGENPAVVPPTSRVCPG